MRFLGVLVIASLAGSAASGQEADWNAVEVRAVLVRGGIHVITGQGGNIGLCVGADGSFLVDDQFAPLTDKIVAAVATVTEDPVRFLVNTHWHGDHTGGNENFGERGAIIVAHANVRRRMSTEQVRTLLRQDTTPPSPPGALPRITFTDEVTFYWNGEEIRAFHVDNAHTDGDSIIHFQDADVFHMGDTFFNGTFPFIDTDLGGNVEGVIAAAEKVLALSKGTTRIIPGHGAVASPDDLRAYRDMLIAVRDRVRAMVNEGRSIDEVVATRPQQTFLEAWTGNDERFVRSVYYSLTR